MTTLCNVLLYFIILSYIKYYVNYLFVTFFMLNSISLAPEDFMALDNVMLSFDIGAAINSTTCVDVIIFDDDRIEDEAEVFMVVISSNDLDIQALISEANVTIIDTDGQWSLTRVVYCEAQPCKVLKFSSLTFTTCGYKIQYLNSAYYL